MIYSVTFHRKPGRKVQTFWFTDKEKAVSFYGSVKENPKVTDTTFFCVPECEAESYDNAMTEPRIVAIDHMVRA